MNKIVKTGLLLSAIIVGGIATNQFLTTENTKESVMIPELHEEGEERHEGKNAPWSDEEAQKFYEEQAKISAQFRAVKSTQRVSQAGYADGSLNGYWQNKGPYNMPGAFQFCEMDEGTDTVYAVTCGHYGGVQFIWKGTLHDDKWKVINPKNSGRFEDLIVLPNGNKRRVIAGKEGGGLMYSDNAGKTWEIPTGISGTVESTIVNRQDNNVLYALTNSKIYKSTNNGTSFTLLQDFGGTVSQSRLYSPRWTKQAGSNNVYLARGTNFYKLNTAKTSFSKVGTIPSSSKSIRVSGDSNKLWVVIDNRKWYSSTNGAASFSYVRTQSIYYGDPYDDMESGQFFGVNPEDPNILIGGYAHPVVSQDGGVTCNLEAKKYWGHYQNSVGNDPKVRNNYHPDLQASQFFYDKDGKLISLRSTDGGIFISYNEWTKSSYPTKADIEGVYYNISLFGKPTQETYRGGFMYGNQNVDHLSCGTQDQGWQDVRSSTYGQKDISWDQIAGGDGPCCITGNGKIGWSYNYQGDKSFRRIQLYDGTTFKGQKGAKTSGTDFTFTGSSYFTPSVGDWETGEVIWVLSQSLRKIEYKNGTVTGKQDLFGSGTSYMQGVAQSRTNANIVFTMRNGIVYKSTNKGTTWSEIASSAKTGISGYKQNRGMGWAIDDNKILFATQSGTAVKAVYSENGGTTWENVTGSGANLFPAAEVNGMAGSKDGKYIFASTNMGPYVFVTNTKKWYPLATDIDMPVFWGQIVYCVDYGDKEVVHFSTWGQGVWDFVIEENVLASNAGIDQITIPTTISCGSSFAPKVTISNLGTEKLTSLTFKVYVDNQLQETITKTVSLAKNESTDITLSNISISGSGALKVIIEKPNGKTDEYTANNSQELNVTISDEVPQNEISIVSFSTEEPSGEGANNGKAIHAIDGDVNTFWHAQWTGGGSTMPHEIVFDLGTNYSFNKIAFITRH